MGKIISVVSWKGGVGKTTSAVNISAYLQMQGKRVCTIPDTIKQRLTRYEMEMALARHRCCDWGEIDDRQWQINNRHAQLGCGKVSSVFDGAPGSALRITTDLSVKTTQLSVEVSPYAV